MIGTHSGALMESRSAFQVHRMIVGCPLSRTQAEAPASNESVLASNTALSRALPVNTLTNDTHWNGAAELLQVIALLYTVRNCGLKLHVILSCCARALGKDLLSDDSPMRVRAAAVGCILALLVAVVT
eukprot:4439114-Amphidinium_carterae.2